VRPEKGKQRRIKENARLPRRGAEAHTRKTMSNLVNLTKRTGKGESQSRHNQILTVIGDRAVEEESMDGLGGGETRRHTLDPEGVVSFICIGKT